MKRFAPNADGSNMEAKYLASVSGPEVKLAPPALVTMSDASAEHAHVVLVEVQLTGVHSVASYVWRAASQSIQVGSTVVEQLIRVDHDVSNDRTNPVPGSRVK